MATRKFLLEKSIRDMKQQIDNLHKQVFILNKMIELQEKELKKE